MDDLTTNSRYPEQKPYTTLLFVAVACSLLLAIGSLIWAFVLQGRVDTAEQHLLANQQTDASLHQQLDASNARIRATSETFAERLGTTQAQLDSKTASILARQQADTARLGKSQQAAEQRLDADVNAVKTDVGAVKTDVGGVRTDVDATKVDLADTKSQLQRTMGDAGVMSGLIARNHDELETLKHKGDRTYYEFTLQKNANPTLLATIKVQLKKVNDKKSKYTMNVSADDRLIEKKDKSLDEPVQFYSGKTPALYEIVVNNVSKNSVSGYLSVPKGL